MDAKEPYLPVEEARRVIAEDGAAWFRGGRAALANSEGWAFFNLDPDQPGDPLDADVGPYEDPAAWEGCDTRWTSAATRRR